MIDVKRVGALLAVGALALPRDVGAAPDSRSLQEAADAWLTAVVAEGKCSDAARLVAEGQHVAPEQLLEIGACFEERSDFVNAIQFYERVLISSSPPDQVQRATAHVRSTRARLRTLPGSPTTLVEQRAVALEARQREPPSVIVLEGRAAGVQQNDEGTISGWVVGPRGIPVPKAEVYTRPETDLVVTSSQGFFEIRVRLDETGGAHSLAPGRYRLVVRKFGFTDVEVEIDYESGVYIDRIPMSRREFGFRPVEPLPTQERRGPGGPPPAGSL